MAQSTPALLSQRKGEGTTGPIASLGIFSSWRCAGRNHGGSHFVPGERVKPSPMLTLRLRRAGRDHGPSQLSSLSRRPEPNRGFNATAPVSPPGPGAPNGNAAGQGWCGVRHEAAPSQSIPLISSQRASSTGKRSLRGRELGSHSRWPWPRLVAHPEKLPGTSRRSAASLERASQPRSHKSPLSAPPGLLEGSSHRGTAGDPHSAREKCRAGTEQLFQPGVSSGRLAGTGGCFPSTHVRSKQRKKEKKSQSFRTAVPLWPLYPSTTSTV